MKNPKWKMLESALATVSQHQYEEGMRDMVEFLARNGFIRKKQATFLMAYIEDPGIQVLNGENNLWFAQMVNDAARTLGIPEELDDRENRPITKEELDEAAYWNHD